jgi:hypothetical protein
MRSKRKWFVFTVAFLIFIGPALLAVNLLHVEMRLGALRRADHVRLLSACREAIKKRSSYRNDNARWGVTYRERVVILPPLPPELPLAIRELHPNDVIIDEDRILVNLSLPLTRIGILGYAPGAPESGTSKYIDGLWFWNGTFSTNSARRDAASFRPKAAGDEYGS